LLLLPLTAVILVTTAIAMLVSSLLLPMPHPADASVQGGTEVVQRFYAAVNETIATGDPADLQLVVAPHFVEENPLLGVEPGRTGLENYVVALHGSVPGLRLAAEVLVASADQVVTRVDVRDDQAPAALPAAFGGRPAVWSTLEIFRVAGGAVVGRWSTTDRLTLARPLAVVNHELPIPTPRVVNLSRVTMAPGARWDAPLAGPRLLFVEEGSLDVQTAPGSATKATLDAGSDVGVTDGGREEAPQRVMLAAGKAWLAPAGARIGATNASSAAAQLLVVTFSEPEIPNGVAPEAVHLPPGVTVHVLAGDLATRLGSGAVTVALEQITLAPDADLSLSSAGGPILVAVETGALEAAAWGTAWARNSRDGMSVASRAARLTAENGLLLDTGGVVTLRNDDELSAQAPVVTIQTDMR